jgi:hypothetical protein
MITRAILRLLAVLLVTTLAASRRKYQRHCERSPDGGNLVQLMSCGRTDARHCRQQWSPTFTAIAADKSITALAARRVGIAYPPNMLLAAWQRN